MPIVENHLIMVPVAEFFSIDQPDYLTVHMEMNENRDRLADLIANSAINIVTTHEDHIESIYMQLGYLGISIDQEPEFYSAMVRYLTSCAANVRRFIPRELNILKLQYAVEEPENVNIIYQVDVSEHNPDSVEDRHPGVARLNCSTGEALP